MVLIMYAIQNYPMCMAPTLQPHHTLDCANISNAEWDDIWVKNGTMFKCWEEVGLILGKHWEKLGVSYILAKLNV